MGKSSRKRLIVELVTTAIASPVLIILLVLAHAWSIAEVLVFRS